METPNVQETTKQEQNAGAPAETANKEALLFDDGDYITLNAARNYLLEFIEVQKNFKDAISSAKLDGHPKAKSFATDVSAINVFVFDKKYIERYFNEGADKYVVVLGANPNDTSTVMFAGCKVEDSGANIKLHVIKPSIESSKPVSEHPPKRLAGTIDNAFFVENDDLTLTIKK